MFSGGESPLRSGEVKLRSPFEESKLQVSLNVVKLMSSEGEFLERIPVTRLRRLENLNMIRRVVENRHGVPKAAILWPKDSDNLLTRIGQMPYSFASPVDKTSIYRIWKLLRVKPEDRPVFQTSITDHLVYVDPATGARRQAA